MHYGTVLVAMMAIVASVTRLWNLHLPATPVYDETHVGRFLNWYHDRAYFFDVHGPLAKLLMYWTASALGFEGRTTCPYESAQPYAAACSLAPQRLVPAICGSCMVPLTFVTCCAMRLHPLASFLCSWFVLIDTLFLGLSRLHLNDMVQMLFIALTHLFAISACTPPAQADEVDVETSPKAGGGGVEGSSSAAARQPTTGTGTGTGGSSVLPLLATGVSLGLALQCKYAMALTTLAWLGLQNLVTLGVMVSRGSGICSRALLGQAALRGLLLLGAPLLIHLGLLALHLSYLPNSGNGDNYMSEAFQSTLVGNKHYSGAGAPVARPHFLQLALEHAQSQFWYNRNMAILFPRGSHPFDTAWYSWPLAAKGVYFSLVADWNALAGNVGGRHSFGFFLHPNPAIVLLTTTAVTLAAATFALRIMWLLRPWPCAAGARAATGADIVRQLRPGGYASLVVSYLLHWMPYATQSRQTFLLYYLPAYYFAILLAGRVWHSVACAHLRPAVAALVTLALCAWTGYLSSMISPIAFGSEVRLHEWTDALRLASTECWVDGPCWVDRGAS
jgi:dolichyl-phosphate-mannose--protein O-mannosyl transferase